MLITCVESNLSSIDERSELTIVSDNPLFGLFEKYEDSFYGDIPDSEYVDIFKKDSRKFDLYVKSKKYLGLDLYATEVNRISTKTEKIISRITKGNNMFNPFEGKDGISLTLPLNESKISEIGGTAGEYENMLFFIIILL